LRQDQNQVAKNLMKVFRFIFNEIVFTFLLASASPAISQTLYANTSNGDIYKINPLTCTSTLLCTGSPFSDIAFCNGVLYATGYSIDYLYSIDTLTGNASVVAQTPDAGFTGLVGDGHGNLLMAMHNGVIYKYNIATGIFSVLVFGYGWGCPGDLAIKDDTLYMFAQGYGCLALVKITLNPYSYVVIDSLDFGMAYQTPSFGLATVISGELNAVCASMNNGGINQLYSINTTDGTTTLICANAGMSGTQAYGLASATEYPIVDIQEEFSGAEFTLSPNPAKDHVMVDCRKMSQPFCEITLADLHGTNLKRLKLPTSGITSIDISGWNSGIYLITVESEGIRVRKKLVVAK
jgi:hypothetical protein